MAMQVQVDPDKPSALKTILGIGLGVGGTAIGTLLAPGGGTVAGMMAGSSAGGAIGNLAGGAADSAIDAKKDFGNPAISMNNGTAIQRRVEKSNDDPFQHVSDALSVLHTLPTAMQAQVKEPLQQAYLKGAPEQPRFRVTNQNFQFNQPMVDSSGRY